MAHMQRNTLVSFSLSLAFLFCAATPALAADTAPPVIGAVTPTIATAGSSVTYSASFVDDGPGGVNSCRLNADGSIVWTGGSLAPNTTSGYASVAMSFSAGTHYLQFQCVDNANNWGYGPQTTVVVSAVGDVTAPTTGDVFASIDEPKAGTSAWYYVNAGDNVGISYCTLLYDNTNIGTMSLQPSGSYALQISFPASTSNSIHSAQARCYDAAGNSSLSPGIKYFTVHGVASDVTPPTTGIVEIPGNNPIAGKTTTFVVSAYDNVGITQCRIMLDGNDIGAMTFIGQTQTTGGYQKDYTFPASTQNVSHQAQARCYDAAGNSSLSQTIAFVTVHATATDDSFP